MRLLGEVFCSGLMTEVPSLGLDGGRSELSPESWPLTSLQSTYIHAHKINVLHVIKN